MGGANPQISGKIKTNNLRSGMGNIRQLLLTAAAIENRDAA